MKTKIIEELSKIEKEKNIQILYACESGSRMWNFASQDSDWDIRFIYLKPIKWYMSIAEKPKDSIEIQKGDLDFAGWELRKSLRLAGKSNPFLHEWFQSDIIYLDNNFKQKFKEILNKFHSPFSMLYHYLHMARGNMKEYLKRETVWLKKYLYVIRPILCCNYIETYKELPPINFNDLCEIVFKFIIKDYMIQSEILKLVENKKQNKEMSYGPKNTILHDFINKEIERLSKKETQEKWPKMICYKDISVLDQFLYQILSQYGFLNK